MSWRGSLTIEGAIVIPIVLLIIYGMMFLGYRYSQEIVGRSCESLEGDRQAITEAVIAPTKIVRVVDAVDDLTDCISLTRHFKEDYEALIEGIGKRLQGKT